MAREIAITISGAGDVKMEGVGFVGSECDAYMKPIEAALAGTGEIEIEKHESTNRAKTAQTVQQRW